MDYVFAVTGFATKLGIVDLIYRSRKDAKDHRAAVAARHYRVPLFPLRLISSTAEETDPHK